MVTGTLLRPRQSVGGVTIDFGAHPLYLLAHLLGMPEEVSAVYGRVTRRAVEDQSVVTMLYPNGALGVAEASSSAPPRAFVEAHGTEGSLLYDPSGGLVEAPPGCRAMERRPGVRRGGALSTVGGAPQREGLTWRMSEPPSS